MKINEILLPTQSWSSIAGVDLTISDDFQQKYRRIVQTLKTIKSLKAVVPYELWLTSVTDVVTEIQLFSSLANDYISSATQLNIKNDSDLNSRLKKVIKMKLNLANYLDHLVE